MTDLGPTPRRDPLSYPGRPFTAPAVVTLGGGAAPRIVPLDGRADDAAVDEVLALAGATPLAARFAVAAIGSNASLAQLAHKYIDAREPVVFAQRPVELNGVDVGYAPIAAGYGAVPATPVRRPGAVTRTVVHYLDAAQVERLDETEAGYVRVALAEFMHEATSRPLAAGAVDLYVALAGYLADGDEPWLLGEGDGRLDQLGVVARLLGPGAGGRAEVARLVSDMVAVPADPAATADGSRLAALLVDAIALSGAERPRPDLPG